MQQDGEVTTAGDSSVKTSTSAHEKPWTRPWELSEIREHAPKWNLAADAGLLKYLEAFSIDFMRKAQESTKQINDLMHDTNMADVKVRNVTGKFMTLSDSQFIENRVYDEDISADASADGVKNENESTEGDIDPFPKLKTAIQIGLKVLEDSFDILDPDAANSDIDSDLDSDEEQGNGVPEQVIYEPKDPYVARPLPHLIGSRGFLESDDVGIRDLPSDDEIAQDDQGSISESDDDVEKLSYRKDSISESESDVSDVSDSDFSEDEGHEPAVTKLSSSSVSDDADLFAESDSDEKEKVPVQKAVSKPKSKSLSKRAEKAKTVPKNEDLFDSDDDNDLFEDSGGLFGNAPNLFDKKSKKGGLFDGADVSDEDSPQNSVDSQDDESQKLSSEEEDNVPTEHPVKEEKSSKPMGGIALFGGALNKELLKKTRKDSTSSDSDSQLSEKTPVKKADDLFADSDEDDLFSEKPAPKLEAKKDKSPPAKKKTSERKPVSGLFSGDSDEDDQFSKKPAEKSKFGKDKSPPSKKKAPERKLVSDLFGDSSDDDNDMLFGDAPSKPAKKTTPKQSLQTDYPKKSAAKKPAIFDSESSDEGMFSRKPPAAKSKQPGAGKNAKDLFDSDSDDDFFTDVKSTPKPSAKTKSFLDSDSGDDLFSSTDTSAKKDATHASVPAKVTAKPNALFDESDHEDKPTSAKSVEAKKSNDLFDSPDEDQEEKQDTTPPARKKPAGAVSMFAGGFPGGELSAAILKRRGVSDASTKSSNSDFSDVEKSADKKLSDISEDKTANEEESDKKSGAPSVNTRKLLPKLPQTSSAAEKPGDKKSSDVSEEKKKKEESEKKTEVASVNSPKSLPKLPLNTTAKPFKPRVKSPQSSSVSNIRNALSINPASLLPGVAPKPKPVVQTEISFDKPPTVNTLESVNKTRARGQRNRRPPTRHSKGRPASKPSPVGETSPMNETPDADSSSKLDSVDVSKPADAVSVKQTYTFSTANNKDTDFVDNLFDDGSQTEKPKSLLDSADLDDELFSGSSLFAKKQKTATKSKAPKLFDDDIFGDDDDFLSGFDSEKKTKTEIGAKVVNDEDDDIFGDLSIGSVPKKSDSGKRDKAVANVVSDNDLFGDDVTSVPATDKERSSSKNNFLEDDDDIFGEGSTFKSKTKSITKSADDIDIFGETPSTKDSKKPVKTKPQADDDIFGDDIFTSAAPSKKKSKKADKKPKAGASIFDDDDGMDDIFATSSSKKKKAPSKSGKKSAAAKESKSESSAVMDDPLSMP